MDIVARSAGDAQRGNPGSQNDAINMVAKTISIHQAGSITALPSVRDQSVAAMTPSAPPRSAPRW